MKFIIGMALGIGAGVAATLLLSNRSEEEGLIHTVQHNVNSALESAKAAASHRERELWREFHERVPNATDGPTVG
jgi:hypothetical protein